jgi:DNA (cytosine-5)-methyltransferase 1
VNAFYNENDPYAAAWLRNLIDAGLIAPGTVDERSIIDVRPGDLEGFTQCHFFAGLGLWSEALRQAGWSDKRPVWTGSCPCQPLSIAGPRTGDADERHLWPAFYRLIAECRPSTVFGEQSAGTDGREWFAGVRADLESSRYACGAADLCAAGTGAPHIRQRLYWVAYADGGHAGAERLQRGRQYGQLAQNGRDIEGVGDTARRGNGAQYRQSRQGGEPQEPAGGSSLRAQGLADAGHDVRAPRSARGKQQPGAPVSEGPGSGSAAPEGLADAGLLQPGQRPGPGETESRRSFGNATGCYHDVPAWNGPTAAIECLDGWRRISAQPGAFPLVVGHKNRMGKLRAYGNAICPPLAAEFITACEEARNEASKSP